MQKINFNRTIVLILIIELFFFIVLNKTYSSDYTAYVTRYNHSHIYVFGNLGDVLYLQYFDRLKLIDYPWSMINFLRPKDIYGPANLFIVFDLILLFFSNAKIDFNIFLNVILIFNTIVLFFFFKKIFNLSKYSDYSFGSLIIFFLFVSNFFLEFYFIRIKTGLCFSFLFLSYILFKKNIILSIAIFLLSFFVHPFYSVIFLIFVVLPFSAELFKKKIIIYSIVIIASFSLFVIIYITNKNLNINYQLHPLRLIAYSLFPLITFFYLIKKRYDFEKISTEKYFVITFLAFIFGMMFVFLLMNEGFTAESFLRIFGFLSVPAIIYIVKINNIKKSLMYNYIVVVNFLLFFKSFIFGAL
jgi:hypothetical protein